MTAIWDPAEREELRLSAVARFVAREIVVVRHGAIPRTTSRKKQRSLAAQWYGDGRFAALRPSSGPQDEGLERESQAPNSG